MSCHQMVTASSASTLSFVVLMSLIDARRNGTPAKHVRKIGKRLANLENESENSAEQQRTALYTQRSEEQKQKLAAKSVRAEQKVMVHVRKNA